MAGQMSEQCNRECSSCGRDCGERKGAQDLSAPPNAASRIGRVVAVASGKGGVGKSLVATMLAVAASRAGRRVGILDADVTGPSIPAAFGISCGALRSDDGIEPACSAGGVRVISLNMLVENPTDPVVWRGPVIAGVVKQFWTDVHWGELDVLFVDMPPGTGDVPLTVFQSLPVDGVVVVSSPQGLVETIVSKSVRMAGMMHKPVLGLVENMSYMKCPGCGRTASVFGDSRAEGLARRFSIPRTVRLPLDPAIAAAIDSGAAETLEIPELDEFAAAVC